jgi:hypothetical protein
MLLLVTLCLAAICEWAMHLKSIPRGSGQNHAHAHTPR